MRTHYEPGYDRDPVSTYEQEYGYPVASKRGKSIKEKGSIAMLMVSAAGLLIVDISIHNLFMSSLMFLTAITVALPKETNALLFNFEKVQKRMSTKLLGSLVGILATIFVLSFATAPAEAQFMNQAQTWLTTAIPGLNAEVTALFFNVLRALFLMYLGVSLIRIVNAARQDEDWQQLARTPLILVVTVVVGDLIAGMVTGGGGVGG
ncbi:hypothetical protein WA1_49225 [Scytonema hofmannii PCC 7110]|uniref:Uncharacterized protein n=1 Tax=Scytonema hofmannii PCC 7110 TaxID=128403 RepID=A0A139WQL8_9CYAN|nr:hypothetical protein [Scytonema hofmannii]KYC34725.1 hypothetical protein WA1_49225 [Scytonema hofmannii PCC 7110]